MATTASFSHVEGTCKEHFLAEGNDILLAWRVSSRKVLSRLTGRSYRIGLNLGKLLNIRNADSSPSHNVPNSMKLPLSWWF